MKKQNNYEDSAKFFLYSLLILLILLFTVSICTAQKLTWKRTVETSAGFMTTIIQGENVAFGQSLGFVGKFESVIIGFESLNNKPTEYKYSLHFVVHKKHIRREGWRFLAGANYCADKKYRVSPDIGILGDFYWLKPIATIDIFNPAVKVGLLIDI